MVYGNLWGDSLPPTATFISGANRHTKLRGLVESWDHFFPGQNAQIPSPENISKKARSKWSQDVPSMWKSLAKPSFLGEEWFQS